MGGGGVGGALKHYFVYFCFLGVHYSVNVCSFRLCHSKDNVPGQTFNIAYQHAAWWWCSRPARIWLILYLARKGCLDSENHDNISIVSIVRISVTVGGLNSLIHTM